MAKMCGVFPTSGNNILPFAQLHVSECKATVGKIMEARLESARSSNDFGGILTPENYTVHNLANSKEFYAMLDPTGWASKYYAYLLCKREKGASLATSHTCKLITNERYKELYNNLLTYFNMKKSK